MASFNSNGVPDKIYERKDLVGLTPDARRELARKELEGLLKNPYRMINGDIDKVTDAVANNLKVLLHEEVPHVTEDQLLEGYDTTWSGNMFYCSVCEKEVGLCFCNTEQVSLDAWSSSSEEQYNFAYDQDRADEFYDDWQAAYEFCEAASDVRQESKVDSLDRGDVFAERPWSDPAVRRCGTVKTTNDLRYETKSYCSAIQFFVVPRHTSFQEMRMMSLFPRLCHGEYCLKQLKIGFRNVNEVLYELQWFTKVEVVSNAVSNKYLYHFFHNQRQLTNLRAKQVTENFRDEDALTYWLENYDLFLSVFSGKEKNRFSERMDVYRRDKAHLGLIHKNVRRNADFVRKPKRKHTSRVVRDRCFRSQKGDKPADQYEIQMFSPFKVAREAAVGAAANFVSDVAKTSFTDIFGSVQDTIGSLPTKVGNFAEGVFETGVSALKSCSDFIKDIYDSLKTSLSSVCEVICDHPLLTAFVPALVIFLLVLILYVCRDYFSRVKSVLVLGIIRVLGILNVTVTGEQAKQIQEVFNAERYELQTFSFIAPIVGVAMGVAMSVLDKNVSQSAGAALNFASRFGPTVTSLEDCLKECFDWMYFQVYGEHFLQDKSVKDDCKIFLEQYRQIVDTPDHEIRMERDIAFAKKVQDVYELSLPILQVLPHMKLPGNMGSSIAAACVRMKSLADTCRRVSNMYLTRVETCCLWLYGQPGQGKTSVIEYITAAIYKLLQEEFKDSFPDAFSRALMHSRDKTSQFWEGYSGQFATIWNEALEKYESTERARTLSELLQACEDGCFPLNMAFDQKGKLFFSSLLAVVTSNISDAELQRGGGLTAPEAIARRRTLYLEVVRGEDFSLAKNNFNEAWKFILRYPNEESFKKSFELGTPAFWASAAKRQQAVEMTFSQVAHTLYEQISQRMRKRTEVSDFVRDFDYATYVKDSVGKSGTQTPPTLIPPPLPPKRKEHGYVPPRPVRLDREVHKKIVQRVEKRNQPQKGHRVVTVTTSTTTTPSISLATTSRDIIDPNIQGYEKQMFIGAKSRINKIVRSNLNTRNEIARAKVRTDDDGFMDSRDFWDQSDDVTTCNMLFLNKNIKTEIVENMRSSCLYGFDKFVVRLTEFLLSHDTSVRRRILPIFKAVYAYVRFGVDSYSYTMKKLKKYGFKREFRPIISLANKRYTNEQVKVWKKLDEKYLHICKPVLFFFAMLDRDFEVSLDSDVKNLWVRPVETIRRLFDSEIPFGESLSRQVEKLHPELQQSATLFLKGHVLCKEFQDFCEEKFSPFMEKFGFLVFGALASCVAGIVMLWYGYSEVETPQQPQLQSLPQGQRYQLPPGAVIVQSLPKTQHYQMPPSVVHTHSLPQGQKYQLPPSVVQTQSLSQGQKYQLPPSVVQTQSPYTMRFLTKGGQPSGRQQYQAQWYPENEGKLLDTVYPELMQDPSLWFLSALKFEGDWSDFEDQFYSNTSECESRDIFSENMSLRGELTPASLICELLGFSFDTELLYDEGFPACTREAVSHVLQNLQKPLRYFQDNYSEYLLAEFLKRKLYSTQGSNEDQQIVNVSQHMRIVRIQYGTDIFSIKGILSGMTIVTVAHFFDEKGLNFDSISCYNDGQYCWHAHHNQVVVRVLDGRRDLVALDFMPGVFAPFKSIKGKLYDSRSDFEKNCRLDDSFSRIARTKVPSGEVFVTRVTRNHIQLGTKVINSAAAGGVVRPHNHEYYYIMADGFGQPGDCAEPYTGTDATGVVRVLGAHTGRTGTSSVFSPLFKSDFPDQYLTQCYIPEYMNTINMPVVTKVDDGKYIYMGKAPKVKIIPKKTRLVASPAQGDFTREALFEVKTAPALLDATVFSENGEERMVKPLELAMKKLRASPPKAMMPWMKQLVELKPEIVAEGIFPEYMDRKKFRMWTMEEAVFGIPGQWKGLPSDTAVGYDVECVIPKARSRKDLWDPETQWIHPLLKMMVENIQKAVVRGEIPKNVVAGCLKDETRDLERVKLGKTRLFCVGALSHLIWTVMVMGSLVMEMKSNRASSDIAIGTDIHSFDWKLIYSKILDGDGEVGAGDFGNYDTSINCWMGWIIGKLCTWKMGLVKDSLFHFSVMAACMSGLAPLLVIIDRVYWMDYFNSSGGWLTGFINSCVDIIIVNFAVFWTCYLHKDEYPDLQIERRCLLSLSVYGDDNIWRIQNKKFSQIFDMIYLKDFIYEHFGMDYTMPTKSEVTEKFLKKEEVTFLARGFSRNGGNMKAPLDEESIYSMLNWIRKPTFESGLSLTQQYQQNIETAMQEWFHYGKERFSLEEQKLQLHCLEIGIEYPALSFETYQVRWLQAQR